MRDLLLMKEYYVLGAVSGTLLFYTTVYRELFLSPLTDENIRF